MNIVQVFRVVNEADQLPRWRSGRVCQSVQETQETQIQSFGKIPWRRKWQPTPVFLPGKFHRQRTLTIYSPWSHKESGMTWQLNNNKIAIYPKRTDTWPREWSAQSCPNLCDPTLCSPLGSSVLGILQARILDWKAISFSRGSFWCRDQTRSPALQAHGQETHEKMLNITN